MNRGNKSSRHGRKCSKNPPHHHSSPSKPSSNIKPPLILPPWVEKSCSADEVWALMSQTEKSWSLHQFSDTPEYWNSITPLFPNSSAEKLRNIHLAIVTFQRNVAIWKKDEIQTLIATVQENKREPMDTPEWWGNVATHLQGRNALDCRIAYNTFGTSRVQLHSKEEESSSTLEVRIKKWTLEEYMDLMKILTRDLYVDTEDEDAMEKMMEGKSGEEVRFLVMKWRPQLLAALEKADRITGSSSKTKGMVGKSDSM